MKIGAAGLVINPGYTTVMPEVARLRRVITGIDKRGWPTGTHEWQAGDRASVHLDAPQLAWAQTQMEIQLLGGFERELGYRAEVCRFDGVVTQLAGWCLGDTLWVLGAHFFVLWTTENVPEEKGPPPAVYIRGLTRSRPRRTRPSTEQDGSAKPDAER